MPSGNGISSRWEGSRLPSHLSPAMVADLLGTTRQAIYDRISRKTLPVELVLGRPLVPTAALLGVGNPARILVAYSPEEALSALALAAEKINLGKGNEISFRAVDVVGVFLSAKELP